MSLWRAQEQNRALRAQVQTAQSVEEVLAVDEQARIVARKQVTRLASW